MATIRHSKQRDLILYAVKNSHEHPTAEMVYHSLKENSPELSLGTVYRNLNFLSEQNIIQKLDVGDGTVHFDYIEMPHGHFYCRKCHCIEDIEITPEDFQKLIKLPHKTEQINLIYKGICVKCQEA